MTRRKRKSSLPVTQDVPVNLAHGPMIDVLDADRGAFDRENDAREVAALVQLDAAKLVPDELAAQFSLYESNACGADDESSVAQLCELTVPATIDEPEEQAKKAAERKGDAAGGKPGPQAGMQRPDEHPAHAREGHGQRHAFADHVVPPRSRPPRPVRHHLFFPEQVFLACEVSAQLRIDWAIRIDGRHPALQKLMQLRGRDVDARGNGEEPVAMKHLNRILLANQPDLSLLEGDLVDIVKVHERFAGHELDALVREMSDKARPAINGKEDGGQERQDGGNRKVDDAGNGGRRRQAGRQQTPQNPA